MGNNENGHNAINTLILLNELQQLSPASTTAVNMSVPSGEDFSENRAQNLANKVGSMQQTPYIQTKEGQKLIQDLVEGLLSPLGAGRTLYKGITKWIPKSMVKKGKHVGGGHYSTPPSGSSQVLPKETLWTTTSKDVAEGYSRRQNWTPNKSIIPKGEVLEFDVPDSYIDRLISKDTAIKSKGYADDLMYLFLEGLPKKFFKKRIK